MSAKDTMATAQPPISTGTMSAAVIQGITNWGRPCGNGPSTDTPARAARSRPPTTTVAPTTAIEDPGHALAALEEKDHRERAATHCERRPVRDTAQDPLADPPQAEQRTVALDREAEELRKLADQHRQRDAVHVAVADRLGQKLGDEAETRHAGQDAHRAGDDRHHAGERDGAVRIAAGQRQDDAEDDGGQRRVRTQDQDAARSEQRIGQQRDDRRIEAVDPGHARRHRVGDAHRHQHRGQNEARHDVVPQPGGVVAEQECQPRQPAREGRRRHRRDAVSNRLGTTCIARSSASTPFGRSCAFGILGRSGLTFR